MFSFFRDKYIEQSSKLRDQGQSLNFRDCPGDSGTVGAYVYVVQSHVLHVYTYVHFNNIFVININLVIIHVPHTIILMHVFIHVHV